MNSIIHPERTEVRTHSTISIANVGSLYGSTIRTDFVFYPAVQAHTSLLVPHPPGWKGLSRAEHCRVRLPSRVWRVLSLTGAAAVVAVAIVVVVVIAAAVIAAVVVVAIDVDVCVGVGTLHINICAVSTVLIPFVRHSSLTFSVSVSASVSTSVRAIGVYATPTHSYTITYIIAALTIPFTTNTVHPSITYTSPYVRSV